MLDITNKYTDTIEHLVEQALASGYLLDCREFESLQSLNAALNSTDTSTDTPTNTNTKGLTEMSNTFSLQTMKHEVGDYVSIDSGTAITLCVSSGKQVNSVCISLTAENAIKIADTLRERAYEIITAQDCRGILAQEP